MNKAIQHAPQSFRGRLFQKDSSYQKEKRILIMKTGIAGLRYYYSEEEEKKSVKNISPGTELLLYREPDNRYDAWAIAVHLTDEIKLGYITSFKNEPIARLMDEGKKLICVKDDPETDPEVKRILDEKDERYTKAPTENMTFPISIYLIEEA